MRKVKHLIHRLLNSMSISTKNFKSIAGSQNFHVFSNSLEISDMDMLL